MSRSSSTRAISGLRPLGVTDVGVRVAPPECQGRVILPHSGRRVTAGREVPAPLDEAFQVADVEVQVLGHEPVSVSRAHQPARPTSIPLALQDPAKVRDVHLQAAVREAGAPSGHTRSVSASVEMTRSAFIASAVSRMRCFGAPVGSTAPSAAEQLGGPENGEPHGRMIGAREEAAPPECGQTSMPT